MNAEIDQIFKESTLIYLSASDQNIYAKVAVQALTLSCQVVLLPRSGEVLDLKLVYRDDRVTIHLPKNMGMVPSKFSVAMFTSGSTGDPKIYAFDTVKINQTLDWYRILYGITEKSAIISPMPTAYNFSFIAGVLNADKNNAHYFYQRPEEIRLFLETSAEEYDKVIILANPIIIDILSNLENSSGLNILIDSGGAPLSSRAIKIFREKGFDMREGYGLTETASLTHFDREGTDAAIGSVGFPVTNAIRTQLVEINDKPMVKIHSPNIGRRVNLDGIFIEEESESLQTTDIGRFDKEGRLILLGRGSDVAINGFYPKDTLESISEIIGQKCALIQHLSAMEINLKFFDPDMLVHSEKVKRVISKKIGVKEEGVIIEHEPILLHSLKLQRRKNNG